MTPTILTYTNPSLEGFVISTDPGRLDIDLIHRFLSERSYWAKGTTRQAVAKSVRSSLCYGVYFGENQVGFASVISDFATFAYLTDIFILEEYRGRGLSRWLIEVIISHPGLQDLNSWMLVTDDAQALYEKFGFKSIADSPGHMEKLNPKFYKKK